MPDGLTNPYAQPHAIDNLRRFLSVPRHGPTLILVGEAPGFHGALQTGVPFTSIDILLRTGDPWGAFGRPDQPYRVKPDDKIEHTREATATIVWRVLEKHAADLPLPLTWNAVPFHPYGELPDMNRTPTRAEVRRSRGWLERFLRLWTGEAMVPIAVGRTAEAALTGLWPIFEVVRHPSHGGAAKFEAGIRDLFGVS